MYAKWSTRTYSSYRVNDVDAVDAECKSIRPYNRRRSRCFFIFIFIYGFVLVLFLRGEPIVGICPSPSLYKNKILHTVRATLTHST